MSGSHCRPRGRKATCSAVPCSSATLRAWAWEQRDSRTTVMRSSKAARPCSTAAVSSSEPRSTATRCQSEKDCACRDATVSRTRGPASWVAITTVTAGEEVRVVGSVGRRPDQVGPLEHDLAPPGGGRLDRRRSVGTPRDLPGQDPRRQRGAGRRHRQPVGQCAVGVVAGVGVRGEDDARVDQRVGCDPVAAAPLGDVPEDRVLPEPLPRAAAPDPLRLEEGVR